MVHACNTHHKYDEAAELQPLIYIVVALTIIDNNTISRSQACATCGRGCPAQPWHDSLRIIIIIMVTLYCEKEGARCETTRGYY